MNTLLLVDADRDSRTVYRMLLEHAGHAVLEAGDAACAMEAARMHRPDLLITELVLPGTDGLALLELLQGEPALAGMLRMVLTTNQQPRLAHRCQELGAAPVLYKPVQPTTLVAEVARVLEPSSSTG